MKKLGVMLAFAAALKMTGLLPFESTDVAKLVPVEAMIISQERGEVVIRAEACAGRGETWPAALEDLHRGAEGTVFLGTAEQVIFTAAAVELLPEVVESEVFRPAAVVCVCTGTTPEPKEAAAYLSAHNGGVTIQHVQAAMVRGKTVRLPVLRKTEGGLRLYGTEDR